MSTNQSEMNSDGGKQFRKHRRKNSQVKVGEILSFRVPDEELAKALQLSLDATGASRNDLVIAAFWQGLRPAMKAIIAQRHAAERKVIKLFQQQQRERKAENHSAKR